MNPSLDWRHIPRALFLCLLATTLFTYGSRYFFLPNVPQVSTDTSTTSPPTVSSDFEYSFELSGILHESSSSYTSSSPYWWVDSGGKLLVDNGVGKTLQGELAASDPWQTRYKRTSSADTDGGAHPQNLFRLLTKEKWDDVRLESSFKINADNFSNSPNRNESNGLLLLSHYTDNGETTYYAGLRVDGDAIIKKKYKGTYYVLSQKEVFPGTYSRSKKTNLLPHDEWIGLRMETTTENDGVHITLSMKREDGEWGTIMRAVDDGTTYKNTPIIKGEFPVGLRTDFMDVEFDDFKAEEI